MGSKRAGYAGILESILGNSAPSDPLPLERRSSTTMCAYCKGTKYACGKNFCPLVRRNAVVVEVERLIGGKREFFGPSPPAVFVGSWGYPKVLAGPLLPPVELVGDDDPVVYDSPRSWIEQSIQMPRLLEIRASLVRGKSKIPVKAAREPFGNRLLAKIQETVVSKVPVDAEMKFSKPPKYAPLFDSHLPPMGPSSECERYEIVENPSVPRKVDRLVYDTDAKAVTAIRELMGANVEHQQIQRVFSVGLLGQKHQRRLVPTKWSITAVDDVMGRLLHRRLRDLPWLGEVLLFRASGLANSVSYVLFPGAWQFEVLEGWTGPKPSISSDHEFHRGRSSYASNIEGAYYAVRHPVLDWLVRNRRQAGVLAFLEVDTPRWVPLGVWRFRELAFQALRCPPRKFGSLGAALHQLGEELAIPLPAWTRESKLVEFRKTQRTLVDYFGVKPKKLEKSPALKKTR
ncbi:MAG: Nre family DNA repair protein [Promethearchaeota archaeon]